MEIEINGKIICYDCGTSVDLFEVRIGSLHGDDFFLCKDCIDKREGNDEN